MKPSASIINIARGEVLDQPALIAALESGTIAPAALDVFNPEPLPENSPLWGMPNVIVTPHISGAVEGYGHKATELFYREPSPLPRARAAGAPGESRTSGY